MPWLRRYWAYLVFLVLLVAQIANYLYKPAPFNAMVAGYIAGLLVATITNEAISRL